MSQENHEWFNKQSVQAQAKMNQIFQQYKKSALNIIACSINIEQFTINKQELDMSDSLIIEVQQNKIKYNRAKEKSDWKEKVEREEMER